MKRHLKQQCFFFLFVITLVSCSKKIYPTNNITDAELNSSGTVNSNEKYIPPRVISVSDDLAKSTKDGELYYDNEFGYRYWRKSDGKYYLDAKYDRGIQPKPGITTKRQKKSKQKQSSEVKEEGYAIQ